MKLNRFSDYINKKLDKNDIKQIEAEAKAEYAIMRTIQDNIAEQLEQYMKTENIGFVELATRLNMSHSQLSKIKARKANLTISTLSHIFAILQKHPIIKFKNSA